jgi:uncharacterized membrane protein
LNRRRPGKATDLEGNEVTDQGAWKGRNFSRREFLTLAGAGAVVGAVIIATMRKSGVRGLLKSVTSNQTQTNPATAGKFIQTGAQATGPSWFQRLLGGKL